MTEGMTGNGGCPSDAELVYGKGYQCPICELEFKNPTVKSSRARMIGSDADLRPVYENINTLKYDVIMCPQCGYAALERYFKTLSAVQKKLIGEKICVAYKPREVHDTFSYEEAFRRYKMALLAAITKQAYDSEKAYICLKCGWLLRGWRESLEGTGQEALQESLAAQEKEYLKNAKEGFQQANIKEDYPLCGMDESTVDYLVAALCTQFGEYDTAMKLVSGIIASREVGPRIKDRARDLKDDIVRQSKG